MTDVAFNLVRDTFLHMLEKAADSRPSLAVTKFSRAYLNADNQNAATFKNQTAWQTSLTMKKTLC